MTVTEVTHLKNNSFSSHEGEEPPQGMRRALGGFVFGFDDSTCTVLIPETHQDCKGHTLLFRVPQEKLNTLNIFQSVPSCSLTLDFSTSGYSGIMSDSCWYMEEQHIMYSFLRPRMLPKSSKDSLTETTSISAVFNMGN